MLPKACNLQHPHWAGRPYPSETRFFRWRSGRGASIAEGINRPRLPRELMLPPTPPEPEPPSITDRITTTILGRAKDVRDPKVFHALSLIAFFAWVGLGADGLSSSSYGPEEMFRALGPHTYLAVALAAATALHRLHHLADLQPHHRPIPLRRRRLRRRLEAARPARRRGLRRGADGGLRADHQHLDRGGRGRHLQLPARRAGSAWKLTVEAAAIGLLVLLNLRGVKESVAVLTPIFLLFVVTHVVLARRRRRGRAAPSCRDVAREVSAGFRSGLRDAWAAWGCSRCSCAPTRWAPAPTPASRPSPTACRSCASRASRPASARWRYMARLAGAHRRAASRCATCCWRRARRGQDDERGAGRALRRRRGVGRRRRPGLRVGRRWLRRGALLFVAAQAGFIDGPRVLANMAVDSWAAPSVRPALRPG